VPQCIVSEVSGVSKTSKMPRCSSSFTMKYASSPIKYHGSSYKKYSKLFAPQLADSRCCISRWLLNLAGQQHANFQPRQGIAYSQAAAMRLGYQLAQVQPQAYPAGGALACGVGAVEGLG
jgi:hypothetical protein